MLKLTCVIEDVCSFLEWLVIENVQIIAPL